MRPGPASTWHVCGTPQHSYRACWTARQVTVLAHAMASREPTGSIRLRRSCQLRRAAVVPRTGRFSGVDQGRHVNHLLVGLLHLVPNMRRLPGGATLSMRTTGSAVGGDHWRRSAGYWGSMRCHGRHCGWCISVLHVASSSRSQVRGRSFRRIAMSGVVLASANIRPGPCWCLAIATQSLGHWRCGSAVLKRYPPRATFTCTSLIRHY